MFGFLGYRMQCFCVMWLVGNGSLVSLVGFRLTIFSYSFLIFLCARPFREKIDPFLWDISEGYCWTRTAERQASRMRARYLKAVLRQDVGYFDLHVTSTAEVITSVSSDSLVIQDVISEKVRSLI